MISVYGKRRSKGLRFVRSRLQPFEGDTPKDPISHHTAAVMALEQRNLARNARNDFNAIFRAALLVQQFPERKPPAKPSRRPHR